MLKLSVLFYLLIEITSYIRLTEGQSYENARCNCICTIINDTKISKAQYIANVPPNNDCDSVILPPTNGLQVNNHTEKFCPTCQCKYESRNTTTIKFVVIVVVWVISLLLIYMMFLICLDPLLNNRRRKINYIEHTNEEDESPNHTYLPGVSSQFSVSAVTSSSGVADSSASVNVLNRVSHHQDKWKRQVQEQRKNIYDRHTMLN